MSGKNYSIGIQSFNVNYTQNTNDLLTVVDTSPVSEAKKSEATEVVKRDEQNPTRIYGDKWIVMQNKLIYSISDLGLDERRMILYLSPIVRRAVDKNPNQKIFTIKVKDYAKEYNITNKDIYSKLREQSLNLQRKNFFIWLFDENEKEEFENSISWSKKTIYKPKRGEIDIELDEVVIEMLTIFDKNHHFTKYSRGLVVNLKTYSLILLELVASFEGKRHKSMTFTIEYLREKFNCVDRYPKNAEFMRHVLKSSAKALEEHTPYVVNFETQANNGGKAITHIVVSIEYKPTINAKDVQGIEDTTDKHVRRTPVSLAQVSKIAANKSAFIDANAHLLSTRNSKTYSEIFSEWEKLLMDKESVSQFRYINVFLNAQKSDNIRQQLIDLGAKIPAM